MINVLPGETGTENFTAYACSADDRSDGSARAQLADAVRLLVVHIGWDHQRHVDIHQETLLSMVRAETLTEEIKAQMLHRIYHPFLSIDDVIEIEDKFAL